MQYVRKMTNSGAGKAHQTRPVTGRIVHTANMSNFTTSTENFFS